MTAMLCRFCFFVHTFLPVAHFVEHFQVQNKQHQYSLSAFKRPRLCVLGIMYEWKEYTRVKLLEEVSLCSSLIDLLSLCGKGCLVLGVMSRQVGSLDLKSDLNIQNIVSSFHR